MQKYKHKKKTLEYIPMYIFNEEICGKSMNMKRPKCKQKLWFLGAETYLKGV